MKRYFERGIFAVLAVLIVAAAAGAESSVWEVRGDKTRVYLAGSCHVLRATDYPLPTEFETAYARSRRIIFEAPPDDLESPVYAQKLMALAVYDDGTTLKEHLRPDVYARAQAFCLKRGYPFDQYQMLRPWMLALMLTLQELQRIGVDAQYGVDRYYAQKAANDGKSISGLESADEQLGFLDFMGKTMGDEQISETLDDLTQLNAKVGDILSAWRKGDEAGIEAFNLRELKNYPDLYAALIVNRNRKWVAKIETLLAGTEPTMVIVGVAHLAGAESVVALLRDRGYSVVKVRY